jgi:hypothetical protein
MLAYATLSTLGYTFYLARRLLPVLPAATIRPFGAMAAMGLVQVRAAKPPALTNHGVRRLFSRVELA